MSRIRLLHTRIRIRLPIVIRILSVTWSFCSGDFSWGSFLIGSWIVTPFVICCVRSTCFFRWFYVCWIYLGRCQKEAVHAHTPMLGRTSRNAIWWSKGLVPNLLAWFVRRVWIIPGWIGVVSYDESLGFLLYQVCEPSVCLLVNFFFKILRTCRWGGRKSEEGFFFLEYLL